MVIKDYNHITTMDKKYKLDKIYRIQGMQTIDLKENMTRECAWNLQTRSDEKKNPSSMSSLWYLDSRMLKIISIGGVRKEIWQFEWGVPQGVSLTLHIINVCHKG